MSEIMSPFTSGASGDAQLTLFHALCAYAATHRILTRFERINSVVNLDVFDGRNTKASESFDRKPPEMIDIHVWFASKSTSTFNADCWASFSSPWSLLRQTRADPFQCLP